MPKIAIIEDDDTMRSLLKTLLEIEGFEVSAANPDDDLMEVILCENPEIVLLDVHLKTGNGISLLKNIRENESTRSLVVFMTSGMDLQDICMQNGADGFLLKPYMPDDLIKLMRNAPSKLEKKQ